MNELLILLMFYVKWNLNIYVYVIDVVEGSDWLLWVLDVYVYVL